MDVQLTRSGQRLVARPQGRLDAAEWDATTQALGEAVREARKASAILAVDLSGLEHLASRELLRVLTVIRRESGDEVGVVLTGATPHMREVLAISRYDQLFVVEGGSAA